MTMPPTDPRALVTEALKLDAEATPGPWEQGANEWEVAAHLPNTDHDDDCPEDCNGTHLLTVFTGERDYELGIANDARFTVRARTLVPQLAHALREALDERQQRIDQAIAMLDAGKERDGLIAEIARLRAALEKIALPSPVEDEDNTGEWCDDDEVDWMKATAKAALTTPADEKETRR